MATRSPEQILKASRRQAMNVADKAGRVRLMKQLEAAQRDLDRRLRKMGAGGETFTATQLKLTMKQIKATIAELRIGMKKTVVSSAKSAAEAATSNTVEYMKRAEQKYGGIARPLPLKTASMLDPVIRRTNASVLRRLSMSSAGLKNTAQAKKVKKGILERYGENTIKVFEDKLRLGIATGKPWMEVRADLIVASPFLQQKPASWAQRIVRTETMAAYNAGSWESIREAGKVLGDMFKILAATFDDRTGWDSYGLHGQIRKTDEAFGDYDGRMFMHPPNRPNDREVVIPHRLSWAIPNDLDPRSDSEVSMVYFQQRPQGPGPGSRPTMSTVPREQFGRP